jgi:hypothetical protein
MKRNNDAPTPAGGALVSPEVHAPKEPSRPRKILVQKKGEIPAVGAPEIAHPIKRGAYERQMARIDAWFFESLERTESMDAKGAHETRCELQSFLLNLTDQLLRIALKSTRGDARRWAAQVLAMLFVRLEKHNGQRAKRDDGELSRKNRAYCEVRAKLRKLRTDVLFPGPIGETVQRELKKAERYRRNLLIFKEAFGEDWKEAVRRHNSESKQKIPEAYFDFVELQEFSQKSELKWWKLLWSLIRENNPDLLTALREGKIATRGIRYQARWAFYRKEFRNVLRTLARLRSGGVL